MELEEERELGGIDGGGHREEELGLPWWENGDAELEEERGSRSSMGRLHVVHDH
uniref:Uncharacterized protein n=1 Tax=Aegilops tauschii TaxID=37682 RepID=N1QTX4_AEGTA